MLSAKGSVAMVGANSKFEPKGIRFSSPTDSTSTRDSMNSRGGHSKNGDMHSSPGLSSVSNTPPSTLKDGEEAVRNSSPAKQEGVHKNVDPKNLNAVISGRSFCESIGNGDNSFYDSNRDTEQFEDSLDSNVIRNSTISHNDLYSHNGVSRPVKVPLVTVPEEDDSDLIDNNSIGSAEKRPTLITNSVIGFSDLRGIFNRTSATSEGSRNSRSSKGSSNSGRGSSTANAQTINTIPEDSVARPVAQQPAQYRQAPLESFVSVVDRQHTFADLEGTGSPNVLSGEFHNRDTTGNPADRFVSMIETPSEEGDPNEHKMSL